MEEQPIMENQSNFDLKQWLQPKYVFMVLALLAITAVVIVSILRDRIVNQNQNQVSIVGQGKVSYQPDVAKVTLGVQVDKVPTGEAALNQLNDKINNIISAVTALGIKKENLKTEAYSLYPQYDYKDNVTTVSGYNANQKLEIKVPNINSDTEMVSKVIAAAGMSGTNQITGIEFTVEDMNSLEQQARVLAIKDARAKSAELAAAAGIKLGKIEGWYENVIQPAGEQPTMGMGGSEAAMPAKVAPQVPGGSQDVIVEMNLTYDVK